MTRAHECFRCGRRCECEPSDRGYCQGCGCAPKVFVDSWLGISVAAVLLGALLAEVWMLLG